PKRGLHAVVRRDERAEQRADLRLVAKLPEEQLRRRGAVALDGIVRRARKIGIRVREFEAEREPAVPEEHGPVVVTERVDCIRHAASYRMRTDTMCGSVDCASNMTVSSASPPDGTAPHEAGATVALSLADAVPPRGLVGARPERIAPARVLAAATGLARTAASVSSHPPPSMTAYAP